MFRTDESVSRFLRLCVQLMVQHCHVYLADVTNAGGTMTRSKCYQTIDAIEALFVLLIRNSSDSSNTSSKINLIHKVEINPKLDFRNILYHHFLS
jgi:hypothetical protein